MLHGYFLQCSFLIALNVLHHLHGSQSPRTFDVCFISLIGDKHLSHTHFEYLSRIVVSSNTLINWCGVGESNPLLLIGSQVCSH